MKEIILHYPVDAKCNHKSPYKRDTEEIWQREKEKAATGAEIGVLLPQALLCLEPPGTGRDEQDLSSSLWRRFDFGLLISSQKE